MIPAAPLPTAADVLAGLFAPRPPLTDREQKAAAAMCRVDTTYRTVNRIVVVGVGKTGNESAEPPK